MALYLAAAVAAVVVLVIIWIAYAQAVTRGFARWKPEIRRFQSQMSNVRLSRRDGDLVIDGQYKRLALSVQLSNSDFLPGLHLSSPVASDAVLSITRRGKESAWGRHIVRTSDARVDTNFVVRTDQLALTKQLWLTAAVRDDIRNICGSVRRSLLVAQRKVQVSEETIPEHLFEELVQCADSMAGLVQYLEKSYRAAPAPPAAGPGARLPWIAAAAAAVLLLGGFFLLRPTATAPPPAKDLYKRATIPKGLSPDEARVLPNIIGWQVSSDEANPDLAAWLQRQGLEAQSSLRLDTHGSGQLSGAAYLLTADNSPNTRRVVWIADNRVLCDVVTSAEAIARIPRDKVQGILAREPDPPANGADGDGLLLVRDHTKNDLTLFYSSNGMLRSTIPSPSSL